MYVFRIVSVVMLDMFIFHLISGLLYTSFIICAMATNHEHPWSHFGSAFYCGLVVIVLPPCNFVIKYKYKRYVGINPENLIPEDTGCWGLLCAIFFMPCRCGRREPESPRPESLQSDSSGTENEQFEQSPYLDMSHQLQNRR